MIVTARAVLQRLFELLYPHADLIVPTFWFGFFAVAFTAIFMHRHGSIRRNFVVVFFIGLLFFSSVSPVALLPYINYHKFGEPRPEEVTQLEVRVIDASGTEMEYPGEATLSVGKVNMGVIARGIAEDRYGGERQRAIVRHLLGEAEQYRERERSPLRYLKYPIQGVDETYRFKSEKPLVGIRIYRVTVTTSPDGTEITDRDAELLKEILVDAEQQTQPGRGSQRPSDAARARCGVGGTGGLC